MKEFKALESPCFKCCLTKWLAWLPYDHEIVGLCPAAAIFRAYQSFPCWRIYWKKTLVVKKWTGCTVVVTGHTGLTVLAYLAAPPTHLLCIPNALKRIRFKTMELETLLTLTGFLTVWPRVCISLPLRTSDLFSTLMSLGRILQEL